MPTFATRVEGALLGAAIGTELGFARAMSRDAWIATDPAVIFARALAPLPEVTELPGRVNTRNIRPYVDLGVRAYVRKAGRVTPEDFAAQLRDDAAIAAPVFAWDVVHTIQEVLKEGMHPRLSGLGAAPCGLMAAAMPAVGLYHFADPEYAYLDGVELASVAQPRLGADWAGLCAAAVAAAFDADAAGVVDAVLKIAHRHNKELFYALNMPVMSANWRGSDADLAAWWTAGPGAGTLQKDGSWPAHNPIAYVLPLFSRFHDNPERFMQTLFAAAHQSWYYEMAGAQSVSAVIGGAMIGALHGTEIFPEAWRAWAAPLAAPWMPLAGVVQQRLCKEAEIIRVTERLAAPVADGTSLLREKVYGNILAGAIGNAMGSPAEGQMYWEIDARFPTGIDTILEPHRLEAEDDNQMAMTLTETYLAREGKPVLARHFGERWHDHLNRDHFFIMCMGNAYDLIRQGWDPRITGHWSQVTGSTVMCMEPVGIYHLADPEFAAIDATAISYMYQRGLDVLAATMLAATVAEAFKPEATVDSVLQAALDAAPRTPLRTFDTRAFGSAYDYIATCLEIADRYTDVLAVRKELYDRTLQYHMIDPLELWGYALAMFKIADGDVRLAAIGGTNIGRDSDTIAGRAAMLAGTLRGARHVPAEWVAMFPPRALARIERNATQFADFLAGRKLPRLQQRQAVAASTGVTASR
jgi:ADP-ribosylglycohydrolase